MGNFFLKFFLILFITVISTIIFFSYFGLETNICNGHKSIDIYKKILKRSKTKPFALIAKTKKGSPVSFMMRDPKWHYRSPNNQEYTKALKAIDKL